MAGSSTAALLAHPPATPCPFPPLPYRPNPLPLNPPPGGPAHAVRYRLDAQVGAERPGGRRQGCGRPGEGYDAGGLSLPPLRGALGLQVGAPRVGRGGGGPGAASGFWEGWQGAWGCKWVPGGGGAGGPRAACGWREYCRGPWDCKCGHESSARGPETARGCKSRVAEGKRSFM